MTKTGSFDVATATALLENIVDAVAENKSPIVVKGEAGSVAVVPVEWLETLEAKDKK